MIYGACPGGERGSADSEYYVLATRGGSLCGQRPTPESVWHGQRGHGGDVARACRRNHDGGWAHSAAIARQVHPAPRRLAT